MAMRLAVKYCGGCNPRYDRGEMVARLRREFPEVEMVGPDAGDGVGPDLVLVVCGCHSVCASHGDLDGRLGKVVTMAEEDFERVRQTIRDALRVR